MSNLAKRFRTPSPIRDGSTSSLNHKPKKVKLSQATVASLTVSPFPDFSHPTPKEAFEVFDILQAEFPKHGNVKNNPSGSDFDDNKNNNSASTCGNVPNVIESLIGTILSQNTSAANSAGAKRGLDAAFGRNDFRTVADAPRAAVVEAIKHGGLANKKAAVIQGLLAAIHARHGEYSLQHLADENFSDEDAMAELVSYDGVGPKTASCVLLFCLGRQSFPVDTHVFRLSRVLGWVPLKANRVSAQAHLDLRIPGELKYDLHVLMVTHGRHCSGCKNRAKGPCLLKTYLKERKGFEEENIQDVVREVEQKEQADLKSS